jgi:hypothetical protein
MTKRTIYVAQTKIEPFFMNFWSVESPIAAEKSRNEFYVALGMALPHGSRLFPWIFMYDNAENGRRVLTPLPPPLLVGFTQAQIVADAASGGDVAMVDMRRRVPLSEHLDGLLQQPVGRFGTPDLIVRFGPEPIYQKAIDELARKYDIKEVQF